MQQVRGDENVLRGPLWVCYCDYDELCSISVALRLSQREGAISSAKGVAFAIPYSCCITRAATGNR